MFLLLSHSPHVPPVVTLSLCPSCCHTLLMFLLLSHSPHVPPVVTLSSCSSCCHTLLNMFHLSYVSLFLLSRMSTTSSLHSPLPSHPHPCTLPFPPTLIPALSPSLPPSSLHPPLPSHPHPCTLPFPPTLIPALSPSLPPSSLHPPLPSHPHPCTLPFPPTLIPPLTLPSSPSLSHPYSHLPPVVRCIKPNDVKSSDMFGRDKVLQQMRYTGVLEAIRIRKEVSTGAS